MESIQYENTMNLNEEVDQPEQEYPDLGAGRSYECGFCKRGFTTAQALGGHMNIHRKDRARSRSPLMNSSKLEEKNHIGPRIHRPVSSYRPCCSSSHEWQQINFRTFFPASTSNARPLLGHQSNDLPDHIPQFLNPFAEEWRMSLSTCFGPALAEDMEEKTPAVSKEKELDLELRLGHDPYNSSLNK